MACLQDTLAQGGSGEAPDAAVGIVAMTANWAEFAVGRNETLIFTRPLSPGGNLLGEIRRNLSVYNGQSPANPLRSLYLAGSSAHAELREKLQESLGIPVHFLDPFAGVEREDLPAANRGAFAGAVALLLLRGQSAALPINFVQPKQPKPPKDPNRRTYIAAAAAAVLLVGVGIFAAVLKLAEKERILEGLTLAKNGLDKQLLILEEEDKKIKKIGDWANTEVVWLDEIYDMVARFPDTDGTRLSMFKGEPLPPKAPTAKDKDLIARMELAGITGQTPAEIDNLVTHLIQDGYLPDAKVLTPNRVGQDARQFPNKFTDKVDVKAKPPEQYQRVLKVLNEAERRRDRGKAPARPVLDMDGGMGGEG